ncbi:MAG: hypothetical protein IPM56_06275 [Ignavibacteriales bacterium]|nr:MAG: hypothetical protein IPM56_06275 [Ignavibacteriales bacterium]
MNSTFTKPKRQTNKKLVPPAQMLRRASFLLLLFFLSNAFSCKEDPPVIPPPPPPVLKDTLTVAITDVTHRSLSVNVQCTMYNVQSLVRLYRLFNSNETLVSEFPITIQDTTIIDDNNGTGLQLNTNYFYYAVRIDTLDERKDSSNFVEAATLDTTSHNYTWQEFVIGEWQSSLYDVWGTDENNVWAVGGLTIGGKFYGAMHWDGTDWTPDSTVGGSAIFGFSANDIWVAGGGIFHYDGQNWNDMLFVDPLFINNIPYTSIWGTSSSNLYLGNQWGKIIHWDGSKARVIQSYDGTYITDISGIENVGLYLVGQPNTSSGNNIISFFNGIQWVNINDQSVLNTYPRTIKMFNKNMVFIGGNNLFEKQGQSWTYRSIGNYGTIEKISGSKSNNIFTVGFFKELYHFNGITWHFYEELKAQHGVFNGVITLGSKVFIAGQNQNMTSAVILIGNN